MNRKNGTFGKLAGMTFWVSVIVLIITAYLFCWPVPGCQYEVENEVVAPMSSLRGKRREDTTPRSGGGGQYLDSCTFVMISPLVPNSQLWH